MTSVLNILAFIAVFINLILFIIVMKKSKRIERMEQNITRTHINTEKLLKENTEVIDLLLDQLEAKIQEANCAINSLHQIKEEAQEAQAQQLSHAKDKLQLLKGRIKKTESVNPITELMQKGLSVQEIAEKLNLPQGEVALKINLERKKTKTISNSN